MLNSVLEDRKKAWNKCAKDDAFYYIATSRKHWDVESFFASGRSDVERFVVKYELVDRSRRMLEIGCGAGRMTRAFADYFEQVHGVDISEAMILRAQELNIDKPNAFFYANDGSLLSRFQDATFDFAFSYIVFQHIPSRAVIQSYLSEISRVLKTDGIVKFQVNGAIGDNIFPSRIIHNLLVTSGFWKYISRLRYGDVNLRSAFPGLLFSVDDVKQMVSKVGLDIIDIEGQNTIETWLTARKH